MNKMNKTNFTLFFAIFLLSSTTNILALPFASNSSDTLSFISGHSRRLDKRYDLLAGNLMGPCEGGKFPNSIDTFDITPYPIIAGGKVIEYFTGVRTAIVEPGSRFSFTYTLPNGYLLNEFGGDFCQVTETDCPLLPNSNSYGSTHNYTMPTSPALVEGENIVILRFEFTNPGGQKLSCVTGLITIIK